MDFQQTIQNRRHRIKALAKHPGAVGLSLNLDLLDVLSYEFYHMRRAKGKPKPTKTMGQKNVAAAVADAMEQAFHEGFSLADVLAELHAEEAKNDQTKDTGCS